MYVHFGVPEVPLEFCLDTRTVAIVAQDPTSRATVSRNCNLVNSFLLVSYEFGNEVLEVIRVSVVVWFNRNDNENRMVMRIRMEIRDRFQPLG